MAFGIRGSAVTNSEKQLDIALERALKESEEFRRWFLSKTAFAREQASLVLCRSDWPWGRVKLRLWNPQTQAYETATHEGETDLLVVFQSTRRGRFALHIENKLRSGRFTDRQPELYRARAAAWAGKVKYQDYDEWETVLVAPLEFYQRNEYEASKFSRFISHEDIAVHISEFRAAAEQALPGDAFKATRA
jgi:hypothetical protein